MKTDAPGLRPGDDSEIELTTLDKLLLRVGRWRFLSVSLLVHVIIVLTFGTLTLFYHDEGFADFVVPQGESFILNQSEDSLPPSPDTPAMPSAPDLAAAAAPDAGSQALSAIVTISPTATFSLPAAPSLPSLNMARTFTPGTGSGTGIGSGAGAGGTGFGSGGGGGGFGTLFGKKVKALKLGVILDRSGSAKPYLSRVLKEIGKDFAKATIVTLHGCGIGSDGAKMDIEEIGPSFTIKGVKDSKGNEVDIGSELRKFREGFNIDNGNGKTDTQHAIKKLLAEKVDAIYWFADFADPVDEATAAKLTKELEEKKVKLVLHSFKGKDPPPALEQMVKKLHGDVIKSKPED